MDLSHFNPADNSFTETKPARLDPRESELAGEDVFLHPAHTTPVLAGPAVVGQEQVWNGTGWDYVEDVRGQRYWLPDEWRDQNLGEPITDLKPLPPEATLFRPPPPADVVAARDNFTARQAGISSLDISALDQRIRGPFHTQLSTALDLVRNGDDDAAIELLEAMEETKKMRSGTGSGELKTTFDKMITDWIAVIESLPDFIPNPEDE